MNALHKLVNGEPTWILIPVLLVFVGLGLLSLFRPTHSTLQDYFRRGKHPRVLTAFQRLNVRLNGLHLCLSGLWLVSRSGARFTVNRFVSAWSGAFAGAFAVIVLSELFLYPIVKNRWSEHLENMSPGQDAAFERKSSQVAVYVLSGVLLVTIAISSIRA